MIRGISNSKVHCGVMLRVFVRLEHVQQCGLASVVQAKEDDVGTLLEEAEPLKRSFEEIQNEHGCTFLNFSFNLL